MTRLERRKARNALRDALHRADATEALAVGIRMGLTEKRAQSYIARFTRPRRTRVKEGARRVCDLGSPGLPGTVLETGPEVSCVQWDHRPVPAFVSNSYLRDYADSRS